MTTAPPEATARGKVESRPNGVTFAGITAIVYGVLGIITSILVSLLNWFFWMLFWPFTFWVGGPGRVVDPDAVMGFAPFLGVPIGLVAVTGIVAGTFALQGHEWARWTLVLLYIAGGAAFLGGASSGVSLVFLALNVVALVGLLDKRAAEWFRARNAS